MNEFKPLATLMTLNENLSKNDGKAKFDVALYQSLVGSRIYLTHKAKHSKCSQHRVYVHK